MRGKKLKGTQWESVMMGVGPEKVWMEGGGPVAKYEG